VAIEQAGGEAEPRHWEANYLPLAADGERLVGILVTEATQRQEAIAETRRRLSHQAALADIGQTALGGVEVDELFAVATAMLRRELGAEMAGILEFAPGRDHLVMCAGAGFPDGVIGRMTAEISTSSQAGYTLLTNGPVVLRDAPAEQRFGMSPQLLSLGIKSAISTPIPGDEEPFGVLGVLAKRPHHFDDADAALVRAVANVLGTAVVREAQAEALRALAAQRGALVAQALEAGEREQRQVADVLHDEVLQHVLVARLEVANLDGDEETKARVQASMDAAAEFLRAVVGGLHPVTLAHAGLTAALESLAAEQRARAPLAIDVRVDVAAEGVHDRLLVSLARELLTNVVKHAAASRADVRVGADDHRVTLTVADDGAGLPADAFETALANGNVGLANARERVAALGGTTAVAAGIGGRGASVRVSLPR
jgi:signal transduction histidine kinase